MCGDFDLVGKLEPGCALSSVGAFFSTAGAGMFDQWIGEQLHCCMKLDADAVGRMVAAACGLVDGVASAHPSMVERCVNMRTALRRFGESASEFVACESARDGEGDLGALYAARDRLRDAGDAFSAAVAGVEASANVQRVKRKRSSRFDVDRAFFEAVRSYLAKERGVFGIERKGAIKEALVVALDDPKFKAVAERWKVFDDEGRPVRLSNLREAFADFRAEKYPGEVHAKLPNGKGKRRKVAMRKR